MTKLPCERTETINSQQGTGRERERFCSGICRAVSNEYVKKIWENNGY